MRIKSLSLDNFGPFRSYEIPFVEDHDACVLLTGKNNEGKSNIILALKLLASACRSIGRNTCRCIINDNECFRLPEQDVSGIEIGRTLHNYSGSKAKLTGYFDNGLRITVVLDEKRDKIYADYRGNIPKDIERIFAFIPPLGPVAEVEEFLTEKYLRTCINTSLAPRHLRNHLKQILSKMEFEQVQDIVRRSWQDIELIDCKHQVQDNTLRCFFREGRIERELAWAGQGLQVWFQILTHLVRLRDSAILILDEPEVNLHAEKQIELMRILKEHHSGSTIVATHSVELMDNVNVSHIIHVQKKSPGPRIKSTKDRTNLDIVRSQIGSKFNLIASQFEDFDVIVFTEDSYDFATITELANSYGMRKRAFNIPLHGFSEYPKVLAYRDAYRLLIGGGASYSVLLDRDYYPEEHLQQVKRQLEEKDVRVLYTPGKEIENIFLSPSVIGLLIPEGLAEEFGEFWDGVFNCMYLDCYGSYLTLHKQFLPAKLDMKTITKRYTPAFNEHWNDRQTRHGIIEGKGALQKLRGFYREKTGLNLTSQDLINAVLHSGDVQARRLIDQVLQNTPAEVQQLHY